jgi:20S proteasome alpha/beta subunit
MRQVAFFVAIFCSSLLGGVKSAHSRRRPARRLDFESRYDRSITTFDSDGRLKQVEYGMEAARRGDSVAGMVVPTMAFLAVKSSDKVHRIDGHILLVTAGLAGDGRALASALRGSCQRFRLSFGEAPTVEEVARMAADIQHELTRTAGARPLGCTAIVAGFDLSMQQEENQSPEIYQTEPGGVMERCSFCSAGSNSELVLTGLENVFGNVKDIDNVNLNVVDAVVTGLVSSISKYSDEEKDGGKFDIWCLQCVSDHPSGGTICCIRGVEEKSASSLAKRILNK